MTAYSHILSLRLPVALLPIAQAISRALDPDCLTVERLVSSQFPNGPVF